MTRNKHYGRKLTMQVMYISVVTLGLFPINAWCLILATYFHHQNDAQAIEALEKILVSVTAFSTSIGLIKGESEKTENYANEIKKNLNDFDKSVEEYYNEVDKWQGLTKPNLKYPELIEELNTKLINEDKEINDKFVSLKNEGTVLGKTPFLNKDALKNTADQYSQNNSTYAEAITDQSMCPNPATKLIKSPNNNSYGKLHQDSCLIIYNLRAYKKLLNIQIRKKHDLIDTTAKKIFDLPDKTMGDHNARKDALMSVEILREKMMYEYKVRTEEIDTRIKIADRTRIYSGAAMVGGVPTKPGLSVGVAVLKGVGALFINSIPTTPYNQ
ncbi:MAG: hypothetical protein RI956_952 [Pseudomonadota bacterium]|jgi:hypothetical protein